MGFIADIFTANQDRKAQTKAADKAGERSQEASDKVLALQERVFNTMWQGTAVQRAAGNAATTMMAQLMGLNINPAQAQQGQPGQAARPGQTGGGSALSRPYGQTGGNALAFGDMGVNDFARNPMQRNALQLEDMSGPQVMPRMTGQPGQPQVMPQQPGAQPAPATPATGAPTTGTGNALNPTDWLRSTPGYQFNLDEGMRALNTGLAGQGRLQSGDAQREAIRYGQNYGDRIYGDQWNRLAGIAGAGQTAQSQGQQAGTNYANNGSNALMWNGSNQMQSSYNKGNASSGFWGAVGGSINNAENMAMRFMGGF